MTTPSTAPARGETGLAERGWYYWGCHQRSGHYLFDRSMRSVNSWNGPRLVFDGSLCLPEEDGLYLASLTRLGGLGYSALAFWDQTVDKRGKSNSAIFAPSLCCSPETILRGAEAYFPAVFKRWPTIDLTRANEQWGAMTRTATAQDRAGEASR